MNRHLAPALILALLAPFTMAHHDLPDHLQFRAPPPYTVATTDLVDVEAAIAPWNDLAGRNVFVISDRVPRITWYDAVIDPGVGMEVGRAYVKPAGWGGVQRCRIFVRPGHLAGAQHELGHCLGFADHVNVGQQGPYHSSAWYCDTTDVPWLKRSTYSGVMSYCSWKDKDSWFGADDEAMMDRWEPPSVFAMRAR